MFLFFDLSSQLPVHIGATASTLIFHLPLKDPADCLEQSEGTKRRRPIAVALHAEKFVQLTNVPGILRNIDDPSTLIKRIERTAIGSLKATGVIAGGMIPKIDCCETALKGGVPRTHIIDGRVPHSLLIEMFSDRGIGTMIY